jgi:hypothetical protein
MFEGDCVETCAAKFQLMSMEAEQALGARTSIDASGIPLLLPVAVEHEIAIKVHFPSFSCQTPSHSLQNSLFAEPRIDR